VNAAQKDVNVGGGNKKKPASKGRLQFVLLREGRNFNELKIIQHSHPLTTPVSGM
jgi:hypothetical protein